MYTTLVAVDIIGFGEHHRGADAQIQLRNAMHELLKEAFAMTGLSWRSCVREGRGDGVLIVLPPEVEAFVLLDPFAHHLNALLRRHNLLAGETTRLRLRTAVHFGRIYHDPHGVTGPAVVHLFRLLEAPAFKRTLRSAGTDLGVIASDRLYKDVEEQGGLIDKTRYQALRVAHKETRTTGWVWLPPEFR